MQTEEKPVPGGAMSKLNRLLILLALAAGACALVAHSPGPIPDPCDPTPPGCTGGL